MLDALTYETMIEDIERNMEQFALDEDTIGILFARPESAAGRDILDNLAYYHFRTEGTANFYLPGYGACWNRNYPDEKTVTIIQGMRWSFSNEMFLQFMGDMERRSRWRYSGDTELVFIDYKDRTIEYGRVVIFYVDTMLRDRVIDSVKNLFDILFRLCRSEEKINIISKELGIEHLKIMKIDNLMEGLHPEPENRILQEKYFSIGDMRP